MQPGDEYIVGAMGVCLLIVVVCLVWVHVEKRRARRKLTRVIVDNVAGSGE